MGGAGKATISYGLAETIGLRGEMEDAHAVRDDEATGVFSAEVYDGHAGWAAAALAADVLTPIFLHGSEGRRTEPEFTPEALRDAYLAADRYIVERTDSGTAAATLHIRRGTFLAANAGDARIVIGQGAGAMSLTVDHKPGLPAERARVEALGGRVVTYDVPRVQGTLAMSRSLGDASLKPFVTAEPRVAQGRLGRANDLAVIACDGLWDVLTPEDAVRIARTAGTPEEAASLLERTALSRGSTDNITVIVLDLRPYTVSCEEETAVVTRVLDRAA